jgi:uncharacterized protein YcfJ
MQAPLIQRGAVAALLVAAATGSIASERGVAYGTVVSATPVLAQVAQPRQVCRDEARYVQPRTSGAGALVGALVGGAIGNAFGSGGGRALATGVGVMAGAVLGNQAEAGNGAPGMATVRSCQAETDYRQQVVGYDVVYDYNGQRFSTRTAQDPGRTIALNVEVSPVDAWQPVPPAPRASVVEPAPVYAPVYAAPAYAAPVYAAPAYVPAPVVVPSVSIGVGVGHGGWGGWRHGGYWR